MVTIAYCFVKTLDQLCSPATENAVPAESRSQGCIGVERNWMTKSLAMPNPQARTASIRSASHARAVRKKSSSKSR